MASVSPFHSKMKNPGVYHTCSNCKLGIIILRKNKAPGRGGGTLCQRCAQLRRNRKCQLDPYAWFTTGSPPNLLQWSQINSPRISKLIFHFSAILVNVNFCVCSSWHNISPKLFPHPVGFCMYCSSIKRRNLVKWVSSICILLAVRVQVPKFIPLYYLPAWWGLFHKHLDFVTP